MNSFGRDVVVSKKNLCFAIGILSTSILMGCSKNNSREDDVTYKVAVQVLSKLSCSLPKNVPEIKPILFINQKNAAEEVLVREKIELIRRKKKVFEGSWDMAAASFYVNQLELARYQEWMQDDVEMINRAMRFYRQNIYPFGDPLDQIAVARASQYEEACKLYIEENKRQQIDESELIKLRSEKIKNWLNPDKRLPCSLQKKEGCKI